MRTIVQKLHFFDYFHEIMQNSYMKSMIRTCQHLVNIERAQLTKESNLMKTKFIKVKVTNVFLKKMGIVEYLLKLGG